jgi:hypothetical protein
MADRTCTIEGCSKPYHSRGLCGMHAQRLKRNGDPLDHGSRIVGDDLARFWSYVNKAGPIPEHRSDLGPCWMWTGHISVDGYAILRVSGQSVRVARWSYEQFVELIPDGLEPDHLCRIRRCVNFERHLEPVTHAENVLRSTSFAAVNAAKTHCPQGHEYTPENTRRNRRTGSRLCRTCQDAYDARRSGVKRRAG